MLCACCCAYCSITELQDQFGIHHSTTADKLPHIAASIAIMSVPGLIAWGADASMRLAYKAGLITTPAAADSSSGSSSGPGAGELVLAADGGGAVGSAAAVAQASRPRPLVPFLSLSYGYLPLVRGIVRDAALWC